MEYKGLQVQNALPLFTFELDNDGRIGIVIIAAVDEKAAYNYLANECTLFKRYRISCDKMIRDAIYIGEGKLNTEECHIVYKNFTDI